MFASACLPWTIIGLHYRKYHRYFSNRRDFFVPDGLAGIIGKPALFSMSNGWAKSARWTPTST
jgi:hypothetical protein